MDPASGPALFGHLTADERAAVLEDLLTEKPDRVADVERLAAARLATVDRAEVAQAVVERFQALPVTAIADRVGRRHGGYVDETEAASEVLEETLAPLLADIPRLASMGLPDAALELGLGIMTGLYRLREEAKPESLLGWLEPEECWELGTSVVLAFHEAGLPAPTETVDVLFPDWAGIA